MSCQTLGRSTILLASSGSLIPTLFLAFGTIMISASGGHHVTLSILSGVLTYYIVLSSIFVNMKRLCEHNKYFALLITFTILILVISANVRIFRPEGFNSKANDE